jgi:hypothetical protein
MDRDLSSWGDQPAFASLLRQHLDLVYATALRRLENAGP